MAWYDPWDELSYFQEELLEWLDDKLGNLGTYVYDITDAIIGTVGGWLGQLSGYVEDLVVDMSTYLGNIVGDLIAGLDWIIGDIVDAIADAVTGIGDAIGDAGNWIVSGVVEGLSTVGDWIGDTWIEVSGFLSDQYDLITGFWADMFADLYFWLDDALSVIWGYFVDIVIPTFMDALAFVFESKPVQWLIGFITENAKALFDWLFTIEPDELEEWAKKGAKVIRDLVESEA